MPFRDCPTKTVDSTLPYFICTGYQDIFDPFLVKSNNLKWIIPELIYLWFGSDVSSNTPIIVWFLV
jgi:hypothetical protein